MLDAAFVTDVMQDSCEHDYIKYNGFKGYLNADF